MTDVLLVVDVQKGLEDPWFGARNNPAMEANGRRLLAAWRARRLPVVIVQHSSITDGSPLRPDQPGFALKDGFEPQAGDRHVVKHHNSAFAGTDLEQWMRARGHDRLTVFGITTEHCVSTTVRAAANAGFRVRLVGDACHAMSKPRLDGSGVIDAQTVHDTELAILAGEFAAIASTDEVVASLAPAGQAFEQ